MDFKLISKSFKIKKKNYTYISKKKLNINFSSYDSNWFQFQGNKGKQGQRGVPGNLGSLVSKDFNNIVKIQKKLL